MSEFETVEVAGVPAGAKVLDVREDYEWAEGHAAGAVHIPMGEIPQRLEELDPDEDTYVICRTGGRSAQIAGWLVGQGYSALNIAGGSGAWLEAGLPMKSENGQDPTVR
ncbi:MAG: rhodanese-like domain-containing protein [Arthrobacter sp.]|uniref:rhodanese-like domain-containing protein n=1 Tax=unclassified Arthrobacter TaxID=235627 RepID=UPI00264FCE12|nr:rhodanese-like domain-containing protein [Micrococcaceae bacterium]MDN5823504.1 rhodanese-like domain-containing protein [Micrococcaceae bacterium]MDN5880018.1 rhodanese-like domain-containing protein [Micrococcaceae bacterium]MDN5885685.1 rhodanese-like domain-containing protein [Micrococcaceae bacterium]MDN5904416.1 rhodanese-like domain-containing protein [Micrococcaceae bacterium]